MTKTCDTCRHHDKAQGAVVCTATGIIVLSAVQRSDKIGSCGADGKKWEPRNG